MKRNMLAIVILAATLVNIALTALMLFTVVPKAQRTDALIQKICSVIELELEDTWAKAIIEFAGITVGSFGGGHGSAIGSFLFGHAKLIAIFVIVSDIFHIVVGSIIEIGYSRFHLNLIDKKEASLKELFQHFYLWKTVFVANILQTLY